MNPNPSPAEFKPASRGGFWWMVVVLAGVLGVLFYNSFDWDMALHSNDGPLGAQMNKSNAPAGQFPGHLEQSLLAGHVRRELFSQHDRRPPVHGAARPISTWAPPSPCSSWGASAWLFFRTLGFGAMASVLGGVAMALNGNIFSHACWGLISRSLSLAPIFLAMAALVSASKGRAALKTILAGLAVGLSVTEGGDNGALFSIYVAAFAFYLKFIQDGPAPARIARGAGTVLVVAVAAGVLAAQSLSIFGSLALKNKGVVQEMQSKAEKWDWATQWSICKAETLRTFIPGVFGYRLDTPGGGNYWGRVGQTPGWAENHNDPEWQRTHPGSISRHSGAGEFTGVLVILVALWALAHSSSKLYGIYSAGGAADDPFLGGRGGPLADALLGAGLRRSTSSCTPSLTSRPSANPMKFMHEFHMGMVILFAYGLQGLSRLYLDTAKARAGAAYAGAGAWLSRARDFEKRWVYGAGAALGPWRSLAGSTSRPTNPPWPPTSPAWFPRPRPARRWPRRWPGSRPRRSESSPSSWASPSLW